MKKIYIQKNRRQRVKEWVEESDLRIQTGFVVCRFVGRNPKASKERTRSDLLRNISRLSTSISICQGEFFSLLSLSEWGIGTGDICPERSIGNTTTTMTRLHPTITIPTLLVCIIFLSFFLNFQILGFPSCSIVLTKSILMREYFVLIQILIIELGIEINCNSSCGLIWLVVKCEGFWVFEENRSACCFLIWILSCFPLWHCGILVCCYFIFGFICLLCRNPSKNWSRKKCPFLDGEIRVWKKGVVENWVFLDV